jgi:hypothetical protein
MSGVIGGLLDQRRKFVAQYGRGGYGNVRRVVDGLPNIFALEDHIFKHA